MNWFDKVILIPPKHALLWFYSACPKDDSCIRTILILTSFLFFFFFLPAPSLRIRVLLVKIHWHINGTMLMRKFLGRKWRCCLFIPSIVWDSNHILIVSDCNYCDHRTGWDSVLHIGIHSVELEEIHLVLPPSIGHGKMVPIQWLWQRGGVSDESTTSIPFGKFGWSILTDMSLCLDAQWELISSS